jgi:hypothetical protein
MPNAIETLKGEIKTFLFCSELLTFVNKLNPNELPDEMTDFSNTLSCPPTGWPEDGSVL